MADGLSNGLAGASVPDDSVTTGKIVDGTIATADIANSAVTTAKINDGAVTTAKLGNDSVDATKLADNAVSNSKVGDSAGIAELTLPKLAVVVYDFSVDGGTAGTITLTGAPTIPDNAIVWVEAYDVETTCTSATDAATITLSLPTDGDLFTAVDIADATNPWDQGVVIAGLGALIAPTAKKCTAARVPQLTVAGGENLTAGKIIFYLRYNVSS